MPIYEYVCKTCDILFERYERISDHSDEQYCPECGKLLGRKFHFAPKKMFQEQYSSALGKTVSSMREANTELRKLEEETFKRTGYLPNYQFVSPSDVADTVTEEGMDDTRRHQVATKQLEVRKWL